MTKATSTLLQGRRGSLQRWFIARVEGEAKWIANIQKSYRHPLLDQYFHWTAILGTPNFFTLSLPGLFFFGYYKVGRPLLVVLSLGAWVSSLAKDLVCSPRPRLGIDAVVQTLGNHQKEYGFPSTHTTNAVTAFLFISSLLFQLPTSIYVPSQAFFIFYLLTVISGRIYNGMHGPLDISGGIALGSLCWAFYSSGLETVVEESFLSHGTWSGLAALMTGSWAALTFHPNTPNLCPCYDQAIAGLGAIVGLWVGIWVEGRWDLHPVQWVVGSGWLWAARRLISGLLVMFTYRVVAKIVLQATLPLILAPAYSLLGFNESTLSNRGVKEGMTKEIWEKSEIIRKFLIYAGITFLATFALPRIFPWIGI